ncbi:hypothetical protein B0H65DRAFT_446716 [Neurospora tetraspora]|uniref:Uncharacterized protein n=1 Tax=Neurospora tetraspora TaxID=94610 RepID=A0AAE0J1A4_9PEZI|nr:hypothetical protein B0H65DRAFT_446716 [Neurospora tetraspora]
MFLLMTPSVLLTMSSFSMGLISSTSTAPILSITSILSIVVSASSASLAVAASASPAPSLLSLSITAAATTAELLCLARGICALEGYSLWSKLPEGRLQVDVEKVFKCSDVGNKRCLHKDREMMAKTELYTPPEAMV